MEARPVQKTIEYNTHTIRTYTHQDEQWIAVADFRKACGITQPYKLLPHASSDNKVEISMTNNNGIQQPMKFINLAGLREIMTKSHNIPITKLVAYLDAQSTTQSTTQPPTQSTAVSNCTDIQTKEHTNAQIVAADDPTEAINVSPATPPAPVTPFPSIDDGIPTVYIIRLADNFYKYGRSIEYNRRMATHRRNWGKRGFEIQHCDVVRCHAESVMLKVESALTEYSKNHNIEASFDGQRELMRTDDIQAVRDHLITTVKIQNAQHDEQIDTSPAAITLELIGLAKLMLQTNPAAQDTPAFISVTNSINASMPSIHSAHSVNTSATVPMLTAPPAIIQPPAPALPKPKTKR
jgi:predicted GIY-YIG superfamily endonuclease